MGIFRFESNDVRTPQANLAKVLHFDCSPSGALEREYGVRNVDLRNEEMLDTETKFDVFVQRVDSFSAEGVPALSEPFKIGELYHHPARWPGGSAARLPLRGTRG